MADAPLHSLLSRDTLHSIFRTLYPTERHVLRFVCAEWNTMLNDPTLLGPVYRSTTGYATNVELPSLVQWCKRRTKIMQGTARRRQFNQAGNLVILNDIWKKCDEIAGTPAFRHWFEEMLSGDRSANRLLQPLYTRRDDRSLLACLGFYEVSHALAQLMPNMAESAWRLFAIEDSTFLDTRTTPPSFQPRWYHESKNELMSAAIDAGVWDALLVLISMKPSTFTTKHLCDIMSRDGDHGASFLAEIPSRFLSPFMCPRSGDVHPLLTIVMMFDNLACWKVMDVRDQSPSIDALPVQHRPLLCCNKDHTYADITLCRCLDRLAQCAKFSAKAIVLYELEKIAHFGLSANADALITHPCIKSNLEQARAACALMNDPLVAEHFVTSVGVWMPELSAEHVMRSLTRWFELEFELAHRCFFSDSRWTGDTTLLWHQVDAFVLHDMQRRCMKVDEDFAAAMTSVAIAKLLLFNKLLDKRKKLVPFNVIEQCAIIKWAREYLIETTDIRVRNDAIVDVVTSVSQAGAIMVQPDKFPGMDISFFKPLPNSSVLCSRLSREAISAFISRYRVAGEWDEDTCWWIRKCLRRDWE